MHDDGYTVLTSMPAIVERVLEEDEELWCTLERDGFYRIQWIEQNEQYARLKWDDTRSKLVAIDGQHRLSALKRFLVDHNAGVARDEFMSWRIPVIVVFFRAMDQQEPPSVLEVVRNIFIYINTQAQDVNEARAILLSDESINSVCTQELIQHSHENDIKDASKRDRSTLPLLFYDWRGEESGKHRVTETAAVKTVEEIRSWLEYYVLGEDFGDAQRTALGIVPTHELHGVFGRKRLSFLDSSNVRNHFRQELLPALSHLLQTFVPYRSYVDELRALEESWLIGSKAELASHAFTKLRFGNSHAHDSTSRDVDDVLKEIEDAIEELKRGCLGDLIGLDIGMRGVVSAFGYLAASLSFPDWMEYSRWFTSALNKLYEDDWFSPARKYRQFLRRVAFDHNEVVINYRLGDVPKGLGTYIELLIGTYGQPMPKSWNVSWQPLKEIRLETLFDIVNRGYKKEVRPILREDYPHGGALLTKAVKVEAEKRAGKQMRRFEKRIAALEGGE